MRYTETDRKGKSQILNEFCETSGCQRKYYENHRPAEKKNTSLNGATWNKGAHGVMGHIQLIEKRLPFPILGWDSDNGGEFLNNHLLRYFQKREKPVQFTRSRPYHSGDNAHVEQKNWTHVRQLFGYYRFEDSRLVDLMNRLLSKPTFQFQSYKFLQLN